MPTDLELHQAQATQDIAKAMLDAAGRAIGAHGDDPDNGAILSAGFCFAIEMISRRIDPTFKRRVVEQLQLRT